MSAPLFSEPGARWWPIVLAPAFALVGIVMDAVMGGGMPVPVWLVSGAVLAAVGALIIHAARTHTAVELTGSTLRLGTDDIAIADIVHVFPPAPKGRRRQDPREPWESARSLGGLSVVPRGRRGIGVQLRSGALRQAWARDDAALRAVLEPLVARRRPRKGATGVKGRGPQ
ncbi:hypothetical protein [Tomitella cavernea]|uniref:DUF3093 domain-containing protein n=1 Tax=Tomitella cavernea TaxID=1387982 RepID=A0ABP9CYY9_9ACTN|nr:hypothetical protein [Tomitella cavernea]